MASARWRAFLTGLGGGALIAYFVDPRLGRARRARASGKLTRAAHVTRHQLRKSERHAANRAHGAFARVRSWLRSEEISDEIVTERVRAAMGRACSHASAVEVSVTDGWVTLCGPVLEREHRALIKAVQRTRGVRALDDRLERHVHPGRVPGLQESPGGSGDSPPHPSRACRAIMKTSPQTAREADNLQQAAYRMALANIGFLPVCDDRRRVLGTVTDRDIVIRAVAVGAAPEIALVRDIMTRKVVACGPDDALDRAERLMAQYQVARIVVTDPDGALLGVISLSDVAEREPAVVAARTLRAVADREAPHPPS